MTKRGRKTLEMPTIEPVEKRWPNPPPGMSGKPARQVWLRIVRAFPADHFRPYQYDLLRAYCEASATHKRAMAEISKQGEVVSSPSGVLKANPWLAVATQAASTMISLSTKLQLTVRSTLVSQGKQPKAPARKSTRDGLLFGGKKDDI